MEKLELIDYLKMVLDVEQTVYTRQEMINGLKKQIAALKVDTTVYYYADEYSNEHDKFFIFNDDYFKLEEELKEWLDEGHKWRLENYEEKVSDLNSNKRYLENKMSEIQTEISNTPVSILDRIFSHGKNSKIIELEKQLENFSINCSKLRGKIADIERKKKENDEIPQKALAELEDFRFEPEVVEILEKHNKYINEQKPYLEAQIEALEEANKESQKVLASLYDQDIIYPRYRNIAAIAAIIDYLESGRCSTLTGDYGAYNKFDMEFNFAQMIQNQKEEISLLHQLVEENQMIIKQIFQLNQVVEESKNLTTQILASIDSSMNNIIENQTVLNQEILRNNQQEKGLLKRIAVNSSITAYNLAQSDKETDYLKRMSYQDKQQ